jgi:hypothetical protein
MKYLLFCMLGMLVSCSKEKPQNEVVDIGIEIFISNTNGENLLLGLTPNAINPDSIRLIYRLNGENFTVYNSNMDCPRAVCFLNDLGSERISITPNNTENEEYPITYIRWENDDSDTIKCHFLRKGNSTNTSIVCDKVWFNDLLVFPDNAVAGYGRAFKIVK